MKPPDFTLHRPVTLAEATHLLADDPDESHVLAGGQSLLPLLNFRLARPRHVIDLDRVGGLSEVRRDATELRIGAMVRQSTAEHSPAIAEACPLLAAALPHVAHPPIRNRGTVGGSLAHADPAAELPAVARALDAGFRAVSARGTRDIPAAEFFRTYMTTALAADEVLSEIRFPLPPSQAGSAFLEVGRRRGDFALVGVAVQVTVADETITGARVCFSGVGDVPHRAVEAERALIGAGSTPRALDAAAESARLNMRPGDDLHASSEYRTHLAGVLLRRAVRQACARAAVRSRRTPAAISREGAR